MSLSLQQMQLEKYGYLRCKVGRRRRRSALSPQHHSFLVSEGNGRRSCSEDEIKTAIKEYQKKYKLPETGVVDEETRKFMSTSRCGNSDSDDNPDIEPVDIGSPQVLSEQISQQRTKKRWKRTAKNTALYKYLFPLVGDSSIKQSSQKREQFLRDHIKKLKQKDPAWLAPERHKRSIIHITDTALDGKKIRDGQKFTKSDIRWRLLQTGISTRIPLEEQRASLNMAFRMWSEVIPLNFEENVSGDIKAVDIEIAFGRGEIILKIKVLETHTSTHKHIQPYTQKC